MEGPLLCFCSQRQSDAFGDAVRLDVIRAHQFNGLFIYEARLQNKIVYITVLRNWNQRYLQSLSEFFEGHNLLLFHPNFDETLLGENQYIVASTEELQVWLDLEFTDEEVQRLQRVFHSLPTVRIIGNLDLIEFVQRISSQHPQPAPEKKPERPLPENWEAILQPAEVAQKGDPVCRICLENKASVCFVACQHMVTCDDCVRRMFTDPELKNECPLCRGEERKTIVRPIMSNKKDD